MIHSIYQADNSAISEVRPSMMSQNNVGQMNGKLQNVSSTRLTAKSLAKSTGGQAFFNSNGITGHSDSGHKPGHALLHLELQPNEHQDRQPFSSHARRIDEPKIRSFLSPRLLPH